MDLCYAKVTKMAKPTFQCVTLYLYLYSMHTDPPTPTSTIYLAISWNIVCCVLLNYLSPFWFLEVSNPPVVPRDWAISVCRGSMGDAKDFTKKYNPTETQITKCTFNYCFSLSLGKGVLAGSSSESLGDGSSSRIRQTAFNFTCERAERWLMKGGG